jgi:hypothetical protein
MSLLRRAFSMFSARSGQTATPARRGMRRRNTAPAPVSPASRILGMLRRR